MHASSFNYPTGLELYYFYSIWRVPGSAKKGAYGKKILLKSVLKIATFVLA